MTITGKSKIAGIVGWPVSHSLSPVLHGHWLDENKIDGAMVPLSVRAQDFAGVIFALKNAGFTGVNVTVPHKEAAFAIAHVADDAAKAAGAANLLLFTNKGIEAHNTDAVGLSQSLKDVALKGKKAVMIGTGGAARGAILALDTLGAASVAVLGRNGARANALCSVMQPQVKATLIPGDFEAWKAQAADAALLLNASAAGMGNSPGLPLDLAALPATAVVCDIVYSPLDTQLLKDARARGLKTLDGLGMLMHQAAPSFEGFFGVKPVVNDGLRAALERALAR